MSLFRSFPFEKIFVLTALMTYFGCAAPERNSENIINDMRETVKFLASDDLAGREIGTDGEVKAAEFISDKMTQVGLASKGTEGYLQTFEVTPGMNPHQETKIGEGGDSLSIFGHNILGFIDNPSQEVIVIGAHYDHLGHGGMESLHRGDTAVHNGADDNASGVAVMLELSKRFIGGNLQKDLLFIAFSGEEKGLWGSNYFVKNPTIDLANVTAMINMDMVGRLNEEYKLVAHGTGTSPVWEEMLNSANLDSLDLIFKPSGVGPSDHTSFYLQDLPVLHFFTGQHEDYHKPGDDFDKLNYQGMLSVADLIERLINQLDASEKLAFTKTKDESQDTPRFKVTLGVVPDYLFDGEGMRIDGVTEGKPASQAGLLKGDVVVQLGELPVHDMMSYMKALSKFESGDTTTVKVDRDGEQIKAPIEFQ